MDGQIVNTTYLTNREMIRLLKDYYRTNRDFPRLDINLNTWSHSIDDHIHKVRIKDKHYNDYEKELYKFDNMLDEYYVKFNAQPLNLCRDKINDYYREYFGVKLFQEQNILTKEATQIMYDYVQGLLWVFNYYFNDTAYINRWYYPHERSPLLRHIVVFLDSITIDYFQTMYADLKKYRVDNLETFFNPIEQLIYVSPMTPDIIKLLPANYRTYITSDKIDPFLKTYLLDINEITNRLWKEKVSSDIDCKSIPYFNKCFLKSIHKPTNTDDKLFLKAVRKVKPTEVSSRRSKSMEPDY
jgi:5'-3' exonuclease